MLNHPLLQIEHLGDRDLELLAGVAGVPAGVLRSRILEEPTTLDRLLESDDLYQAVFGPGVDGLGPVVTPFLAFGLLVGRAANELGRAAHVPEWSGPGKRLPVFDVESLRSFLEDRARRFFLTELLASFTKVASGSFWVRTRRGFARRRFSELDPVRLAEMVEMLPEEQRPGGYRRLGDVALFLCGVFPDYTARHPFPMSARERMVRSAGVSPTEALIEVEDLRFLESTAKGWYRRAVSEAEARVGRGPGHLTEIANRLTEARRILNYLADNYLFRRDIGLIRPAG